MKKSIESSPRPLLLPCLGSFPPVSSQLLETFKYDGRVLSCKLIRDFSCTVYDIGVESNQKSAVTEDKNIEEDHRFILILQVNDLSNESIQTEEIMRKNYRTESSCFLRDSGNIISVGTGEGLIILLEKKLEEKEGESLPQHDKLEELTSP